MQVPCGRRRPTSWRAHRPPRSTAWASFRRTRLPGTARGAEHSAFSGASHAFSKPPDNHAGMTLTIAIIVNAVLMAAIVLAVARMIHLPYRIERRLHLRHAVYLPGEDDTELRRAA